MVYLELDVSILYGVYEKLYRSLFNVLNDSRTRNLPITCVFHNHNGLNKHLGQLFLEEKFYIVFYTIKLIKQQDKQSQAMDIGVKILNEENKFIPTYCKNFSNIRHI